MQFYVQHNAQQSGPHSLEEVRARLANRTLQPTDLAWHEGATDWQPISAIPDLAGSFSLPVATATSRLAVASLVLGILGFLFSILTAIPAVICGHVSLARIKRSSGALSGSGMAIAGLVMGYMEIALLPIIAILAAIALPAFTVTLDSAKAVQSNNDLAQIVNAVQSYYTEYGRYPIPDNSKSSDNVTFGDGRLDNKVLFDVLRAINPSDPLNPRQIKFLELPSARNKAEPRSGIGSDENFYDPWGHQYIVRIDSKYSGQVTGPDGQQLSLEVIAWSLGPKNKKIIASWR